MLRGCLCPCCAGIAALGIPALPPASQTGLRPVMMQLRQVAGEASLLRLSLSPVASLLYPASAHSNLAFYGLAEAVMALFFFCFFFGVALVSLPALHWRCCQHQAVFVAGIAPALLLSWPLKVWPVQCWRLPVLCWCFARIALASLPASCCCCCCRCCAGVVVLSACASLPSSCAPCGGICPSTIIAVRGVLAVSGIVYACPLFSVT
jgi:hypothetical protein